MLHTIGRDIRLAVPYQVQVHERLRDARATTFIHPPPCRAIAVCAGARHGRGGPTGSDGGRRCIITGGETEVDATARTTITEMLSWPPRASARSTRARAAAAG